MLNGSPKVWVFTNETDITESFFLGGSLFYSLLISLVVPRGWPRTIPLPGWPLLPHSTATAIATTTALLHSPLPRGLCLQVRLCVLGVRTGSPPGTVPEVQQSCLSPGPLSQAPSPSPASPARPSCASAHRRFEALQLRKWLAIRSTCLGWGLPGLAPSSISIRSLCDGRWPLFIKRLLPERATLIWWDTEKKLESFQIKQLSKARFYLKKKKSMQRLKKQL